MENVLVYTEVVAVSVLSCLLALAIQPLLVMAVFGVARKAVRLRQPQAAVELNAAELRLIATGPKISSFSGRAIP
jgi:hypothetical protein